jgi:hypothetical protein
MSSDFKIDIPFDAKPPRLKELVNKALMGDVWIRDTPFGPVTDSIIVAKNLDLPIIMFSEKFPKFILN